MTSDGQVSRRVLPRAPWRAPERAPWRTRRRVLLAVLGWLLVGAAVNVLVAWAGSEVPARSSLVTRQSTKFTSRAAGPEETFPLKTLPLTPPPPPTLVPWPRPGLPDWPKLAECERSHEHLLSSRRIYGAERWVRIEADDGEADDGDAGQAGERSGRRAVAARAGDYPVTRVRCVLHEHLAGAPMRSMAYWRLYEYVPGPRPTPGLHPEEMPGLLHLAAVKWFRPSGLPVELPLIPLWPGFLVNTVVYAVPLWAAWRGARSAARSGRARRQGRRRKAGACGACGYDRRGTAAEAMCPECGKR